jgi:N-acetylmuramoyl-L-alanine amidase
MDCRSGGLVLFLLAGATGAAAVKEVSAIRLWPLGDVTRVAIQVSGEFEYRSERLANPNRVFFDILNARPNLNGKRFRTIETRGRLIDRIRIAETQPGTSRIVFDLAAPAGFTVSQLVNPHRLIIEFRAAAGPPDTVTFAPRDRAPSVTPALGAPVPEPPRLSAAETPKPSAAAAAVAVSAPAPASGPPPVDKSSAAETAVPVSTPAPTSGPPPVAKPARRRTDGGSSLIRALGLKTGRIVIDAGHGGHDQGTIGRKGYTEKELVLDLAQRLGKLVEDRLGLEVVYTRCEDVFLPLEARTTLANEKRADLFVSLHANSSPYSRVAGVETYYLNFTSSKEALEVAARENASSEKSIHDLRDLITKITRSEKADESRDLAERVQTALHSFSSRYHAGVRNRGVKRAPFVVLIGAEMPSILAEVGFLSNPREETLLRRPEHRQKLAEALYRGISQWVASLSRFQVAHAGGE